MTGKIKSMQSVQIFGVKSSQDARAAERFFKERRVQIHMVDLAQKPMATGEIKRYVDKFGLLGLVDTDGKAYADAGLKYLRVTDTELLRKIEEQPKLLKLPLVRSGNRICNGRDEKGWTGMLEG